MVLEIAGMKCAEGCTAKVQKALEGVEGVESVTVAMAAEVEGDAEKLPDTASIVGDVKVEALIAAVEELGFKAECPKCDKSEKAAAD